MTDKEQINDLACVLDKAKIDALTTLGSLNGGFGQWYAKAVYNAGYRNINNVIKEFSEKLKELLHNDYIMPSGITYERCVFECIDELLKEYGAEVEE